MSKKTRYFMMVAAGILAVGLGTGLVASYMGLPVSLVSQAAGPSELQYVPADAAVVAYADVRNVMNSQFRQRFRQMEPSSRERDEFEQKTGLDIEQDIDTVVAAFMPREGTVRHDEESALVLARGRFEAARLEALALEHGGSAEDYRGKRLLTHLDSRDNGGDHSMSLGFVEADLVALGATESVKRAIDARAENRNVVSNNDLMRLVAELGIGRLETGLAAADPWPIDQDASHHMGTTRMGVDPASSVVDPNGRVHGVENVYLAGASVFPTSGCANPTFTIVALSIRLARHLRERVLAAAEAPR